jgi:hypothetical protein
MTRITVDPILGHDSLAADLASSFFAGYGKTATSPSLAEVPETATRNRPTGLIRHQKPLLGHASCTGRFVNLPEPGARASVPYGVAAAPRSDGDRLSRALKCTIIGHVTDTPHNPTGHGAPWTSSPRLAGWRAVA